jgi:DNA-directed RNA polymerase specialized sigma24 family protein
MTQSQQEYCRRAWGRHKRRSGGTAPVGRPRRQRRARLEFTPQAYRILEAAATVVLHRWGLLSRGYFAKEDLISVAWEKCFFYLKKPEDVGKYLYLDAITAMRQYLRGRHRPWCYEAINPHDENDPVLNRLARELDDPAVLAEFWSGWRRLDRRRREILWAYFLGGYTTAEIGQQWGLCSERIGQIVRPYLAQPLRRPARAPEER